MAIYEPERIWWKTTSKDDKLWVSLALFWMFISFTFMPVYHFYGKQNPPDETYRVSADDFEALVDAFTEKYALRDGSGEIVEEQDIAVVRPDPDQPVFLQAKMFEWSPVLILEKGETYRIHLSSLDVTHGFSIQPVNINLMVLPEYDYVATIKPTTTGDFRIICNEFCGIGHHMMVGKVVVVEKGEPYEPQV